MNKWTSNDDYWNRDNHSNGKIKKEIFSYKETWDKNFLYYQYSRLENREKAYRCWNCFLFHCNISIGCRDTRIQSISTMLIVSANYEWNSRPSDLYFFSWKCVLHFSKNCVTCLQFRIGQVSWNERGKDRNNKWLKIILFFIFKNFNFNLCLI